MKNLSFNQFAGITAIFSAFLYIVSIVGMQFYLAEETTNMTSFVSNMNENSQMMLTYGWPGLFATLFIIPIVLSIHQLNQRFKHYSRFAYIITMTGLTFVMVGYMMHLALTYFHTTIYANNPEHHEIIGIIIKTTIGVQDLFWLTGDLFAFLGIALLALLGWKEGYLSRTLAITGTIAGLLASIGSFGFIPSIKPTGLGFVFIIGFSIFAIWEVILGIRMLSRKISI